MIRRVVLACVVVALALLSAHDACAAERSPFSMVRFRGEVPEVEVEGVWYRLESINGIPFDRIRDACVARDRERWAKRFCEDLEGCLQRQGLRLGDTVLLRVRPVSTSGGELGEVMELAGVPLTLANRQAILKARPWHAVHPEARRRVARPREVVRRVTRDREATSDERYRTSTQRVFEGATGMRLSASDARADLEQLEWLTTHTFSYRMLSGFADREAYDAVWHGLAGGVDRRDLQRQLGHLLGCYGDGHTRVRGVWRESVLPGWLPGAPVPRGARTALLRDGEPLVEGFPWLIEIDGESTTSWLAATEALCTAGSLAFVRMQAHDRLGAVAHIRRIRKKPGSPSVTLTLGGAVGNTRRTITVALEPKPTRRRRHELGARTHGDVLHVSIPSMNRQAASRVPEMIRAAGDIKGLVLDVRGNGGGSRDLLRALMPHLMPEGAAPMIANVAAYRVPPGHTHDPERGDLENRALFPVTALEGPAREHAEAFLSTWRPDWTPDPTRFSPWHVLQVAPAPEGAWRYTGPVVVLIDGGCFSATDIFVGALERLPQVTLVGSTTGGGSGRSRRHTLRHSGLEVRISSMASFRPTGARYDGVGIAPDIAVDEGVPGGPDLVLKAALKHLAQTSK